ncbi:MAG: tetratricopeptide repeat protein [Roseiflexus sp.]|nr:tetratricopeptide repeat protein [Roseiflexus sp.]
MAVQLAGWVHRYLEALCAQPHFSAARTVAPLWLASDAGHSSETGTPISAPMTIQMAAEIFPRLALIGPAGAGKTTTLRALAVGLAEAFLSGNSRMVWSSANAPLPLYLELARFQGSIEATLTAAFGIGAPPPLDELARERPLLFLLDGLDELPPASQLTSLAALSHALAATGAQTRWICTCRSEHLGLFRPWLNGAEVRTLQPLRPRDVIAQVQRQIGDVAAAWVQRNDDIVHLATCPRWLAALIEARDALTAPIQSRGQLLATWMPAIVTAALTAHPRQITASQAVDALIDIARLLDQQGQDNLSFDSAITAVEVSAYAPDMHLTTGTLRQPAPIHGQTLRAATGEAALLALIDAGILTFDAERRTIGFRHPILRSFAQALLLARIRPDQWPSAILSRAWTDAVIFAYGLSEDRNAVVRRLLAAGAVGLTARCLIDAEDPAHYDELLERSGSLTPPLRVMIADAFAAEGLDRAALEQLERAGNEGYDEAGLFGRLGDLYSRSGQWRLARVAYEQALAREADDLRYRQQLGVVCSRMGELEQAAAALETVLDAQQKRSAAAAHELGHVYLQQGRFARALEAYRHAVQQQPGEPTYRRSMAAALRRLGRLDEAEAELCDLIAASGGDAATYAELGEVYADASRFTEAVERYARAVALRPDDPTLYARLGQLRRNIGDLPGARAALQQAVELNSSNAALQDELGQVLEACGEMESALAAYRAAVSLDPQCAAYHRRLGALLRDCGDYDGAAAALRTALELRPDSAETYSELAELLWRAGATEQALDAYRRAYALAPDSPDHARALGLAYRRLGRARDAERLLREALALAPDRADLHYDYGVAAEALEQWDTALAAYEQAAALDPQRADYARAAGALLLRRGDLARARRLLAAALRRARRDPETLFQVGMLHAAAGDWHLAARSFQRAARSSGSARHESALGRAYLHLGMANEACTAFERALLLYPDDAETLEAYQSALEMCGRLEAAYAVGRQVARLAPGNAAIQQRVGSLALRLGRVNEALELLDRAVALDSYLVAAHLERSRALLAAGRAEAALAAAQQACALAPDQAQPMVLAAEALIALRRDDEARPLLEQALALDATLLPACVALRDLLARTGNLAAAVSMAQRVAALAPDDASHHAQLGELFLTTDNPAQAEQSLHHALRLTAGIDKEEQRNWMSARIYALLSRTRARVADWERAIAYARASVEYAPGESEHHALLAEALEGAGDLAAAIAELEIAAAAEPERIDWQQRLGRLLYRTGDYTRALHTLRRAVAGSGAAEDYHALGMCLRALDNLPAAAEALEQALRLRPDAASWRVELGLVHLERGWHGEALAELNQAIATAPDLPDAWRARARAFLAIDQVDNARANLIEALRRNPRDAESYALLAETLIDLGHTSQALESARRAVALHPDNPHYRRALARALRASGQRAEAAEHLSRVISDASPAQWWEELADDHLALGDLPAARAALERAVAAAPDHAAMRFRLGDVLLRLGEPAAAVEQLRVAIARRSDYAAAHARLAEALITKNDGDYGDAAVEAARLAVALEGRCADHWRVLGAVLRAQGALDDAVDALQRAHELDPESAPAAFLLGLTLLEQNNPAAAVAPLAAAVAAAPENAAHHGYLGIAHRSMVAPLVEPDELRAVPTSHRAALTIARRSLQQAITLDPRRARWWYELGLVEQQSANHAPAVEAFERAIALLDNQPASEPACIYPSPADVEQTAILRSRALSLYLIGRLDAARADLEALIARDAALPSDRYLLGRILLDGGDAAAARAELTVAAAGDPSHAPARLFLGCACLALNEPLAAIEAIEQAASLRPDHAPTAAALSQAYAAAGRRERAIAAAQRAVRLDASVGAHHHLLATLYAASGRFQEARAALINALTLQPDVAAWHAEMGDICERMGMIDAARSAYARAVHLAPDQADYRYAQARLLRQQGRIDEARQVFEEALKREPHQGAWHYELAELLRQHHDPSAIDHYVAAVQLAPDEPRHWLGLVEGLLERNEHDVAQETVERALLRFSDNPALHAAAGAIQEAQGDIERAAWHYERALERDPQNARYCWRLGRAQLELGNLDAARELLERALALDPGSADAHATIARLFALENDGRAALIHSQRAAELRPDDPAIQIQLAEALAHMRRFEEARQALERALQRAPSDPELLARYGEMALTVGLHHEALNAFERAIAQRPDEPRYHFLAGRAHRRLKQYSRAIERFRRAVRLRPGYSEAVIELSTLGPLAFVAQHLRGESDAA